MGSHYDDRHFFVVQRKYYYMKWAKRAQFNLSWPDFKEQALLLPICGAKPFILFFTKGEQYNSIPC